MGEKRRGTKWRWARGVFGSVSAFLALVGLAGLPEDRDRWMNEWLPALPRPGVGAAQIAEGE